MKVKTILKKVKQPLMEVVLNGGKHELDDATIPFQIAFDKSIALANPSGVLVVDITDFHKDTSCDAHSERTIFKLEPVNYLQLKKPGIHHLIFILLDNVNKDVRRHYGEKNSRSSYHYNVYFKSIEENMLWGQLCYTEAVVEVPEEFFAKKPKTKFGEAIWSWVNSWYDYEPVDECEYRKRKIWAFTLKPILWLLGFIPRLIWSLILTLISSISRLLSPFIGYQPVSFFPKMKETWLDFLIKYPKIGYKCISKDLYTGVLSEENYFLKTFPEKESASFYPYKKIVFAGKKYHLPITFFEVVMYLAFLGIYILCLCSGILMEKLSLSEIVFIVIFSIIIPIVTLGILIFFTIPTLKGCEGWKEKSEIITDKIKMKPILLIMALPILALIIKQVPWTMIWKFLLLIILAISLIVFLSIFFIKYSKKINLFVNKLIGEKKSAIKKKKDEIISEKAKIILPKVDKHLLWLSESFDPKKLPEKVNIANMPKSSTFVHVFTVRFWWLKAKVCKPYPK